MTTIESWVLSYLLNALWQVPLVFAAGWLASRLAQRMSATAEHRVWVGVLLAQAALPALSAASWGWLQGLFALNGGTAGRAQVAVVVTEGTAVGTLSLSGALMAAFALAYGAVVAYFAGRLVWQWHKLRVLQNGAMEFVPRGESARSWQHCRTLMGTEIALLAFSGEVSGPVTIGLRRKMLLLPAAMAHALDGAEMRSVFAHELAHMRRNDFAKNLAYELISIPLRFHPVCWLTRQRVMETRELVCDEMAAEIDGRTQYARSLLRLAAWQVAGADARTPQAIGIFDTGTFERRVMRLTEKHIELRSARRLALAALCAALGAGTFASALALRMHVDAGAAGNGAAANDAPGRTTVPAGEMAKHITKKVTPRYPVDAKKARLQGTVVLEAVIGKDGIVENLKVLSGPAMLQHSALDAVRQWTYEPYLVNGDPVEVEAKIHIIYSLAR